MVVDDPARADQSHRGRRRDLARRSAEPRPRVAPDCAPWPQGCDLRQESLRRVLCPVLENCPLLATPFMLVTPLNLNSNRSFFCECSLSRNGVLNPGSAACVLVIRMSPGISLDEPFQNLPFSPEPILQPGLRAASSGKPKFIRPLLDLLLHA